MPFLKKIIKFIYKMFVVFPWVFFIYILFVPILFFGNFYRKKSKGDIVFFITSVFYFKQKRLCYSDTRSVFSPKQRELDTIKTIKSIREKIPSAKIALIEAGLFSELSVDLKAQVDYFIFLGNNFFVRFFVDSANKSFGEAVISVLGIRKLNFNRFFKISGRYWLNDNFDLSKYDQDEFCFKELGGGGFSTRLYSFPGNLKLIWTRALLMGLPYFFINYPIEFVLGKMIHSDLVKKINKLGLSGVDACNSNCFIDE